MGKIFNALKWMKPEDSENLTKNQKNEQGTSLKLPIKKNIGHFVSYTDFITIKYGLTDYFP